MIHNKAETIRESIRDFLKKPTLENVDNIPLAQLGIDSLDFFEWLMILEEKYEIDIPIEKLDNDITIGQLIYLVDE